MKAIMRIAVFIEKQGEDEDRSTPLSQAKFYIDSDLFFDEQQAQHLASSVVPLITAAVLGFESEDASGQANKQEGLALRKS